MKAAACDLSSFVGKRAELNRHVRTGSEESRLDSVRGSSDRCRAVVIGIDSIRSRFGLARRVVGRHAARF